MRHNEEGPVDVCADRICYAETKKCLVHSFTHDGKRKFTVKVEGIGYIHGVALLKDSSVLVAKLSPGRHSIVHISQDGKEKMLRLELNEIAAPRIFAVHRTKRKILLVQTSTGPSSLCRIGIILTLLLFPSKYKPVFSQATTNKLSQ
jgi:hypothetical protein